MKRAFSYYFQDIKFAQAETEHFTTFVVMSRLKHDYATLTHRPMKIISSYDPRIVVSFAKDTVENKEQLVFKVSKAKLLPHGVATCKQRVTQHPLTTLDLEVTLDLCLGERLLERRCVCCTTSLALFVFI